MTGPAATILIVDDEIQNCKLLETLLRPEGYLTLSVASGEEALAAIARRAPDLILLDIKMPGMDGYEVARQLKDKRATSNIPIIMVTVQTDRSARLAGLNAGAEEFLTKPIDRAELWLRVRNLLRLKEFSDFLRNHSSILEQQVQARTADLQRFRTAMDAIADAILLVSRAHHQPGACAEAQRCGGGRRNRGAIAPAPVAELRRDARLFIQLTGSARDLRNQISVNDRRNQRSCDHAKLNRVGRGFRGVDMKVFSSVLQSD